MKMGLMLSILLSNILFAGCSKNTSGSDSANGSGAKSNLNKSLLVQLVNEVRASGCNCGSTQMPPVSAVQWNEILETVAVKHSSDMNTNNYFSHTGSDNTSPGDRITAAGYQWRTYGENIAQGAADERAVVQGWLQSEPHCRNIMNANFSEMGVGRAGSYWTQVFGTRQ